MHRRALLASALGLLASPAPEGGPGGLGGGDAVFDAWLQGFRARAVAKGLPAAVVDRALADLSPDPRVLALDGRQPEFSKPISDYLAASVSPARIAQGQARLQSVHAELASAERASGVPAVILLAVWGIESGYGAVQGDFDVVRSYATLAAKGRRSAWAEGQLVSALKILASGEASREALKGSWAGAMGQTQFTPEDYLNFAVDGDGDGRRDIWRSSADALASTGNFLNKKAAWRRGQSWAREVVLPREGFDFAQVEAVSHAPAEWVRQGVRPADGFRFRREDEDSTATLLLPMGWRGPAFLAFPNHMAIRAYNNSTSYALAVGLLADRIGGAPPLVQPWPVEAPLSLADRMAAQAALARAGFNPGAADGVIGAGTRKAVRAWQAAHGLPAEGYLSNALVARLKGEG